MTYRQALRTTTEGVILAVALAGVLVGCAALFGGG